MDKSKLPSKNPKNLSREDLNKIKIKTRTAWVGKGLGIKNRQLKKQYSLDGGKTWKTGSPPSKSDSSDSNNNNNTKNNNKNNKNNKNKNNFDLKKDIEKIKSIKSNTDVPEGYEFKFDKGYVRKKKNTTPLKVKVTGNGGSKPKSSQSTSNPTPNPTPTPKPEKSKTPKEPKHWIRTPLEQEMGSPYKGSDAYHRDKRRKERLKVKGTSK